MIELIYRPEGCRSFALQFARELSVKAQHHKLVLPSHAGKGYMCWDEPEPGFSYMVMQFQVKQELRIFRLPAVSEQGMSLFFNNDQISDYFVIQAPEQKLKWRNVTTSNMYLSLLDHTLSLRYSAGCQVRRIGVYFSWEYLKRHLQRELLAKLRLYAAARLDNIHRNAIPLEVKSVMNDVFQEQRDSMLYRVSVENNVRYLCEQYLRYFMRNSTVKVAGMKDRSKLIEEIGRLQLVETVLTDPGLKYFPQLHALADKAMMSTSNLKIKFKEVYGKTPYDYFNTARLSRANELLMTGRYSSKQAALEVGFSSLSNFAKAFHRHFGVTPSAVKRSA